ncbi:MAG: DNA methyltransferase, partial [Candidatus Woesearchaeota archaeon]
NFEHYDVFLDNVKEVIQECYRVLKPGRRLSIVTANVNQNTKKYGLLSFPIATDLIKKAQEVGFVLINELIWSKDGTGGKWGSHGKQRPIFGSYPHPPNFLFKNVHEYIVILKKMHPKKNNSKAPKYEELFQNNNY